MNIIAAIDENCAIGYKGNLLVTIPEDHSFFKETTIGKIVVMGRKTLESLPQKRPLENRINIVLSQQKDYKAEGAIVVHSIEECMNMLSNYSSKDIYIIGGVSIYEAFLPYADVLYVTKIYHTYEADVYFPDFKENGEWTLVGRSEIKHYKNIDYGFQQYRRC